MKDILVINSGSSSIKFQLIEAKTERVIVKGAAEKLGLDESFMTLKLDGKEFDVALPPRSNHADALGALFGFMDQHDLGKDLSAVGHRVVHGGETFRESVLIDDKVIAGIKAATPFAPLHNPANLLGIEAVAKINPDLPQVAVFDTAFHSTMPPEAYRYAVPTDWYKKHGVCRYGFHGTSYQFVTARAAQLLGKEVGDVNLIIAHLGNGASVAAIRGGRSVATTMGFTPLAGLPMATRSGNIDPGIIPFIMERENLSASEVIDALNKKSGHGATTGTLFDWRDITPAALSGNADAKLAFDIFTRKVAKYIAGFMADLPSLDALVFTAGVGGNDHVVRAAIVERLGIFGFKMDDKLNAETLDRKGKEGLISDAKSTFPVYMIGTNEELMIARDTARIVG
ncbi:MAG: acetate kinase [Candidatus Nomurabacteria bacterium]|jgi:acetate kinase|nr:acetate kinase [Candidatus Nomurabacteria bacterium]